MKITMKNEKIIKVLVADNSEFAKNNLRDFLESSEGIQLINVVDNGKDAYHFIMDEAPDIVLIDVILPVMDGFTVIEKVNARFYEIADGSTVLEKMKEIYHVWMREEEAAIKMLELLIRIAEK